MKVGCEQTGYQAKIEFLPKPLFLGKPHQIKGEIFHTQSPKKPIAHLTGDWRSKIYIRRSGSSQKSLFTDVKAKSDVQMVGFSL